MFLITFARYSSHLMSELSFYTAWDETVHTVGSHGVSVVRLPPTKLRASIPQSSLVQLVFETAEAEGSSFLFHHSSTPFITQNSVYDFMTASRRKSSRAIPSGTNTKVVLALVASVNGAARHSLLSEYHTVSGHTSESGFIKRLRTARISLGRFSQEKKKSQMPNLVTCSYLVPTRQCTWHVLHLSPHVKYGGHTFDAPIVTDAEFRQNRSRYKVRVEVNLPAYARNDWH
jgi:hypothetical protein